MGRANQQESAKGAAGTPGPAGGKVRKPHRYHPGTVALMEIRRATKGSEKKRAIRKAPMQRLVREVTQELFAAAELRFTQSAMEVLHEAAEDELVALMLAARVIASGEGLETISPAHFDMAQRVAHIMQDHSDPVALAMMRANRGLGVSRKDGKDA